MKYYRDDLALEVVAFLEILALLVVVGHRRHLRLVMQWPIQLILQILRGTDR
jgi:hypothetical protein